MKKLYIILSLITLLILASCSSSLSDMHSMDDGSTMQGANHEESESHVEGDSHEMEDGSSMNGSTHSEGQEFDEESIVGYGDDHEHDGGEDLDGHTHTMEDGSSMQGATHNEGM